MSKRDVLEALINDEKISHKNITVYALLLILDALEEIKEKL